MPEPGMGSRGSRGGSGMGGGGGYAGPELDWGMGPEGDETTEVSRSTGEDRDFGDDVSLQQKTAFMATAKPVSKPVSTPPVVTPVSNVTHYLEDTTPTPLQDKQTFMSSNPSGHPSSFGILSATTKSPDQPTNVPKSWSDVAKTDIEAKKHAAVTMPSDSMASFLLDDDAGLTGGLNIRTTSSGRTSGWKNPNFIDRLAEQKALVDALPDWAQNWRSLLDIRFDKTPSFDDWFTTTPTGKTKSTGRPISSIGWNSETGWPEKFGIAPNTIGRRISTRAQSEAKRQLEKYGPRFASRFQDLSDQEANIARQVTGMMRTVPSDEDDWFEETKAVPAWDRIRHADLLTRAAAINKEKNRFDRLSDPRRVSANPFYDLMRHGFMANETSLPVSQFTEFDSLAQPSDFYNNVLASKFMRPDQKFDLNSSAASMFSPFDTNFFAPPVTNSPYDQQRYQHWENVLGSPASASSRIGGPMDAFGKLAYREMMNPGSTGYNFNTNVTDQGLWERPVSDWWDMMKNASGQ